MAEDYYSLLGVAPDASEEAILEAYRRAAAEHHPDVSDDPDAEATIRRLNRAKAVLTDDARRQAYDRLGHDRFTDDYADPPDPGDRTRAETGPSTDRRGGPAGPWPVGVGSLLYRFDDAFDAGSGRFAAHGPTRAQRAGPPHMDVVDLSALLRGGTPPDSHQRATASSRERRNDPRSGERECPRCHGRGTFIHVLDTGRGRRRRLEACERCGGDGTESP
jgi:molecular chaperone DnaJ